MAETYTSIHTGTTIDSFVQGPVPVSKGGTGTTLGILHFQNKVVSSWSNNTDANLSTDYPYKGTISCSGVTSNHIPTVIFDYNELISGNYAPYADSGTNVIYIYSKVQNTITVPTIYCL